MRRIAVGRVTLLSSALALSFAQYVSGCGSASEEGAATGGRGSAGTPSEGGSTSQSGGVGATTGESGSPGETGGSGAGGSSGGAGTAGASGGVGNGGFSGGVTSGAGGDFPNTGGVRGSGGSVGEGGSGGCFAGVPCECEGGAIGTLACGASGGTCDCPPAKECSVKADAPCFEPCGGDPFGTWVLQESCFGKAVFQGPPPSCQKSQSAKDLGSDLRVRILDRGVFEVYGGEHWEVSSRVGLDCLNLVTINQCRLAEFGPDPLIIPTYERGGCQASACGACDCRAELSTDAKQLRGSWSRTDETLRFGLSEVQYCVKGDELWIGGQDPYGVPKVSYRFSKQSCHGVPLSCEKRTAAQCTRGAGCSLGVCRGATGSLPRCQNAESASDCSVLQGCVWDPEACAGAANDRCGIASCGAEPGCTLGPPEPRCGGFPAQCEERGASDCDRTGCSTYNCRPNQSDYGPCRQLASATDCGKAPGCTWASGVCAGNALCTDQTDAAVCAKLDCIPGTYCGGIPFDCEAISAEACYDTLGCRIEW